MKNFILVVLLSLVSFNSIAQITLTLDDEQIEGNTKICIYSDSQRTYTITKKSSQNCPHTYTFDE